MASIHASPGGLKFGEDAAQYDFARPSYPPELFAWLRERCGLDDRSTCFEIGAGTGHATLPILAMPVQRIVAIEPDARLVRNLSGKTAGDGRLTIEIGPFEQAHLKEASFDFGFAAMSLHWLARMKALAKVRAALKPGGWFAMWWNVYHDASAPDAFGRATEHLFSGVEQDPNATSGKAAFALDVAARTGELRSAGFKDIDHRLFEQDVTFTPERLAALYATFSRVRMAPQETRERLMSDVKRVVREEFGGTVTRTIVCSAYCARKP